MFPCQNESTVDIIVFGEQTFRQWGAMKGADTHTAASDLGSGGRRIWAFWFFELDLVVTMVLAGIVWYRARSRRAGLSTFDANSKVIDRGVSANARIWAAGEVETRNSPVNVAIVGAKPVRAQDHVMIADVGDIEFDYLLVER